MDNKVRSVPKHDEEMLIKKINSMSKEEKKKTALKIAEILLEETETPILDNSIGNLTQSFNIGLLAGLNQDERTMMISHKLAVAMSSIISLQNDLNADIDIYGPDFSEKTRRNLQSRLKYLNFSEFSIYIKQKKGHFLRKTIDANTETTTQEIEEDKLGLNMQNILLWKWEKTGFNFKISQVPVEGIWEDFAIAINDDIFIAWDDFGTAREISHSIELFEMVGIVIEQAIVKQQWERDDLTGLLNRNTFSKYIEWKSWFFIMFDIDKFKRVNDTYWHDIWDEVIKKVSEIIENNVKTDRDVVCRWWWEEISVFLSTERTRIIPKSTAAINAAERIRNKIEKFDWSNIFNGKKEKLTISWWISRYYWNLEESYKKADLKLYEAKENWRNQIIYHRDALDDEEEKFNEIAKKHMNREWIFKKH